MLAVRQVVPGEAGERIGPDELQAHPERSAPRPSAAGRGGRPPAGQSQEDRPPEREDQRHHHPAEPGVGVGQPDPLDRPGARRRIPPPRPRHRATSRGRPDGRAAEERGQGEPGEPAPVGRREREPEQEPRREARDHQGTRPAARRPGSGSARVTEDMTWTLRSGRRTATPHGRPGRSRGSHSRPRPWILPQGQESDNFTLLVRSVARREDCEPVGLGHRLRSAEPAQSSGATHGRPSSETIRAG